MINVNIAAFMRVDGGTFINLSVVESFTIEELIATQEFRTPDQPEKVTKQIRLVMPTGTSYSISMTSKELDSFMKNGVCLIGKK
jgi:hypothetical protein